MPALLLCFIPTPLEHKLATTLGVGALLVASAVQHSALNDGISAQELLVTVSFFLTAPIGAYLVSKAALHLRLKAGKAALPPRD